MKWCFYIFRESLSRTPFSTTLIEFGRNFSSRASRANCTEFILSLITFRPLRVNITLTSAFCASLKLWFHFFSHSDWFIESSGDEFVKNNELGNQHLQMAFQCFALLFSPPLAPPKKKTCQNRLSYRVTLFGHVLSIVFLHDIKFRCDKIF